MDSGVGGLDVLVVGSETTTGLASDSETKQRWYGSGFLKQERSVTSEDDLRSCLKVAKTDDFSVSKAMLLHQQRSSPSSSSSSLRSEQQQMLSFSSPKSEAFLLRTDTGSTYPYFPSAYNRNTGYNSGSLNAANMHGLLTGIRGPFTPSQWIELEHQALIYQYITANVPIPSNLLVPIRKALDFAGFSSFSGTPFRPNTLGWGTFHLGFANSTDPEPGRCRRTDGKKWRCSRDAVADQKYCERHMNRGRHRSRKPVEGQTGHSVAATTTTTAKSMPIASSSLASVAVGSGSSSGSGGTSNSLTMMHNHQVNHLQLGASNTSAAAQMERIFMNKENLGERMLDTPVLSMLSPTTTNLNSKDNHTLSISKQQMPHEESTQTQFGLVSSDSLLNPSNKPPTFMNCRNYGGSSSSHDEPESKPPQQRHPLRRFMDDWPKNQLSDRTQLSISIPSDFMSSTSSRTSEKPALSPLRLSMELDSTQMGLGVGSFTSEQQQNQRQANWIPISWETSMGGPLGEVLHNSTNSNKMDCRNTSPLNLMTEGWDHSPRLGSSPTGVLQKSTAFGSLSNSSAGSSPRAEYNKTHEGSSFCNDLLGSSLANSSSLPSL